MLQLTENRKQRACEAEGTMAVLADDGGIPAGSRRNYLPADAGTVDSYAHHCLS